MKADLHCHTVLSDGAMRVDQIIPYAKRIGLDYIAISDHESTHSIPEEDLGKSLVFMRFLPSRQTHGMRRHRRMFIFYVIIRLTLTGFSIL